MSTKKVLGRGLSAIIEDVEEAYKQDIEQAKDLVREIDIERITPNPYQPRVHFNEVALRELSESIKRHGLLQPIIVVAKDDAYMLLAGERRLRASKLAGFIKIKEKILQHQILELVEGLDVIFKNHVIDEVAIEDIFYAYNPKTVLKLAQFRGALSLKILQIRGNFSEYTALQVKKAVTGNGKATKEQVAFMVKKILGIRQEIKPLDITDAIAIAIAHSQRLKI